MMYKTELSIIIPVYNVEKYIRACLDSVIAQTYRDYELLLIDDGSTDKSGIICDEYARLDNVRAFHTENCGVSHARNIGIVNAVGKYIYFIDGDDLLADNNTLQFMMSLAESRPGNILRFRVKNVLPGIIPENLHSSKLCAEECTDRERICSMLHGAFVFQFLIPKSQLGDHRFNEGFSLGEDVLFLSGLLPELGLVIDCDRVIYYRRIRDGSAVHADMKDNYYDDICNQYRLIEENLSRVDGGNRVFEAICADQTGAIKKISRNYRTQANNIRRARNMIMQTFPKFLWNPWLGKRTRIILLFFVINPKLYFELYARIKKEKL